MNLTGTCTTPYIDANTNRKLKITNNQSVDVFKVDTCTGNALFGQWTWSGEGIKPLEVEKDKKHKVAKFKILKASVRAYQRNLNTHSSYRKLRQARAELRAVSYTHLRAHET